VRQEKSGDFRLLIDCARIKIGKLERLGRRSKHATCLLLYSPFQHILSCPLGRGRIDCLNSDLCVICKGKTKSADVSVKLGRRFEITESMRISLACCVRSSLTRDYREEDTTSDDDQLTLFLSLLTPIQRSLRFGRASRQPNMDALVRRSIQTVESKKKGAVPWEFDKPYDQPYHHWVSHGSEAEGSWQAIRPSSGERPAFSLKASNSIALFSWNIDFMLPYPDSRMGAAIRHLERQVAELPSATPAVIFLNECLHSDMKVIASDPWVQKTFLMTDIDGTYWQSGHYGTTTLVDRRLPIQDCFRVHYSKTRMERDGLFVDIKMGGDDKLVRLCNTHLESLAFEPPFRPPQMQICASYMHDRSVHGAILAGDLNAIQDFDRHLHIDNGLKDAYLELGGEEDDAENGHTWGQQAATTQRERFGTSRMDKVYFCGGVECTSFERFGMDVQVEDEEERETTVKLGFEKPWITDHLGIKAMLTVTA